MNKKYIDFVPKKEKATSTVGASGVSGAVDAGARAGGRVAGSKVRSTRTVTEVSELEISDMFEARSARPRAGVTVTKRSISRAGSDAKSASSGRGGVNRVGVGSASGSCGDASSVGGAVSPKFVKTEVEKRPLSKNVYPKKVVVPKEEKPSKPVTIIHKPEKDSKVGLIVTIIITIILGAAAGTVAFLLLPK